MDGERCAERDQVPTRPWYRIPMLVAVVYGVVMIALAAAVVLLPLR